MRILDRFQRKHTEPALKLKMKRELLSKREKQVFELVSNGYLNKEIAYKLKITEHTVKNHVSTIMSKMYVRNRTELAIYYWKEIRNTGQKTKIYELLNSFLRSLFRLQKEGDEDKHD